MRWLLLSHISGMLQGRGMKLEQDGQEEPYINAALDICKETTNVP